MLFPRARNAAVAISIWFHCQALQTQQPSHGENSSVGLAEVPRPLSLLTYVGDPGAAKAQNPASAEDAAEKEAEWAEAEWTKKAVQKAWRRAEAATEAEALDDMDRLVREAENSEKPDKDRAKKTEQEKTTQGDAAPEAQSAARAAAAETEPTVQDFRQITPLFHVKPGVSPGDHCSDDSMFEGAVSDHMECEDKCGALSDCGFYSFSDKTKHCRMTSGCNSTSTSGYDDVKVFARAAASKGPRDERRRHSLFAESDFFDAGPSFRSRLSRGPALDIDPEILKRVAGLVVEQLSGDPAESRSKLGMLQRLAKQLEASAKVHRGNLHALQGGGKRVERASQGRHPETDARNKQEAQEIAAALKLHELSAPSEREESGEETVGLIAKLVGSLDRLQKQVPKEAHDVKQLAP